MPCTMEGGVFMATITQMTGAARSIYTALYAGNSRTDATSALFGGNTQRSRGGAGSLFSAQRKRAGLHPVHCKSGGKAALVLR